MIDRPVFTPTFAVEVIEPEGVYLLSERGHFVLKGELYCALAPLLDGTRTADDLVDALGDVAGAAEVYYALSLMETKGYAVEAAPEIPAERAAFWHATGIAPALAEQRLQQTPVSIVTLATVPAEPFAEAFAAMGLRPAADGAFTVVVTDDYLQEGLAEINTAALASGRPWLLVRPVGTQLWVGPLFVPGVTACWECLAQRLRANREVEGYLLGRLQQTAPLPVARAATAATMALAAQLAALEAAKAIGRGLGAPTNPVGEGLAPSRPEAELLRDSRARAYDVGAGAGEPPALPEGDTDTTIITLDTLTLETVRHTVVRRPQCPACGAAGDPYQREPLPVRLQSQTVRFTADGGHRTVSPEQTIAKYERQVSSISGAVSSLIRTPVPGSEGLHVYAAGHNLAMKADSLYFLRRGLRSKSAGKGVGDAQAKASALCEAIERYSGILQGDEPRRRARYRSLGRTAIHPNACMLFSEAQYAARAETNARAAKFNLVTDPFDEEAAVDWTPVWSLTHETFKYLPTAYCDYGYPMPRGHVFCRADSNGNASGNTLEEAILQGFFELVERDAIALWWYNRVQRPGVDLDSFGEPYLTQAREEYARLGRELWALDLTSDLGIPVFAAVSRRVDQPVEQILFGFGAHFDPRIALLRAVTEMNQMLSFSGAADRETSDLDDPDTIQWLRTATVANQPYVAPSEAPVRRRADFSGLSSDDIAEDILRCRQIVEARGMEMLVLDQTRPDVGLPVAKVIVPGLRHFWARFAPGRLYDVPVQLGWLPAPLPESQLNPIPMFL